MNLTPNLHFPGNAKQAIELYQAALGAEVDVLHFGEEAKSEDYVADNTTRELVYHCELRIGGQRIMLSDITDAGYPYGSSMSLVVTFDTAEEVRRAFWRMEEGATVVHPMKSTSYSSCFVSLIDRFGMRWELMTEQTER